MDSIKRLLVAVLIIQGIVLIGQWGGQQPVVQTVHAQVPDAGAQRGQMVEELRTLNRKMDRLMLMLEQGNLQVRTASPDENRRPADAPRQR
jgi:hypothetical protein